jgi:hypothetical protein
MTDNVPDEPGSNETRPDEQEEMKPEEAGEIEDTDELDADALDADEIEQELLNAMKRLRRTNKKVEEYLDGIASEVDKPAPEQTDTPAE